MKQKFVISAILFLTFLVWAPTLGTYFSQDDWVFLSHTYKQPFLKIFDHHSEAFYRPVGQQLFFWLGSSLFGLDAGSFHLLAIFVHLVNIILLWKLFRYFKISKYTQFLLLIFYAVNPAHFVALNWLTQIDIEIAVSFALLAILFWKKTVLPFIFFLGALLAHETVLMLPIVMAVWTFKGPALPRRGRALLKPVIFFFFGILVLVAKFLANPFSSNADYTVSTNILGIFSTLKWYGLRALSIPEGIRNFPVWLAVMSLIPAVFLLLIFRQKLIKGILIYLLGILPVLGFGSHLLAAYSIFGIALMAIELGRNNVIPAILRQAQDGEHRRTKAGIYLNRFRVPPSLAVRLQELFVHGSRSAIRRAGKPGMTVVIASITIMLSSLFFIYFIYPNHWSTTRGIISQKLTEEYLNSGVEGRSEILTRANDFIGNPEIYFSSMMGRQYQVLDRGVGGELIDVLFYRGNDMTTQFLPEALFFKNSFLAGKFPIWNPWIMAGMPYFLDPQNFLWYPPNYLLLFMPLELGFLILLIGHLVFSGWGVKKILDESGISGKLGLLGMGMFIFSPKLISHIEEGNWSLVIAACWLPFFYWALKNKRFNWTAISLSAIIINNLNIGYYAVLFTIIYCLTVFKRPGLALARPGLKMFLATFLLTIPRWLPLALFGNQTVRANLQEAPLPFWSWMKIAKSLFFPLAGNHPLLQNEEILYIGIIPVLVIIAYLLFKGPALLRQQGRALFWIAWLGFVSLIAINVKTPFFYLIKLLPGFSFLRITTRPWIFVPLALAVFVPKIIGLLAKRSKLLAGAMAIAILLEYAYFDYGIFSRRQVVKDKVPYKFYQTMVSEGNLVRVYCTTGCLDRMTAQKMGIALLGGNNPIQLTEFVNYLQKAGGYMETAYFPILPPYTVFNQRPQPNAELLAQTATKFVISPYKLKDDRLKLIDREKDFRLYQNMAGLAEYKDHYFSL